MITAEAPAAYRLGEFHGFSVDGHRFVYLVDRKSLV